MAERSGEAGARGLEAVVGGLRGGGREAACSVFESPAVRVMVSGKFMLKNLVSGSRYFILITFVETFLTTTVLVYSPPGSQLASHSRPSPQSTPKRRMRSLRPSGAGRDAMRPAWPDNAGSKKTMVEELRSCHGRQLRRAWQNVEPRLLRNRRVGLFIIRGLAIWC